MNIMLTDFWNVVNSSGGAEKVLCRHGTGLCKSKAVKSICELTK